MELRPISRKSRPDYPPHRRQTGAGLDAWLRRAAAVAATGTALWLGGCYGATPMDDDPDVDTRMETVETFPDVEYRPVAEDPEIMSGAAPAPSFYCESVPEHGVGSAPGYLEGWLCGAETAFGAIEVWEGGRFRLTVDNGAESVFLSVLDPSGVEVGTLEPGDPPLDLDLAAGRHTLEATAAAPDADPHAWFTLSISGV